MLSKIRNYEVNGYRVYSFLNTLLAIIAGLALPLAIAASGDYGAIAIVAGVLLVAGALALLIMRNRKLGATKLIVKYTIFQLILSIIILIISLIGLFFRASEKATDIQNGNY